MANKNETIQFEKKGWKSTFRLVGEAKIGDYTYSIDEKATKSDWIYNRLNLGVNCGDKFGVVYGELMGGYGAERDNILYVHGRDADGADDYSNKFQIAWEDRFDESYLDEVGDSCFIRIGLEKDKDGKNFTKKFLSAYDAIAYVKDNLIDGAKIVVNGNLKYSVYNGTTQVKKEITSIYLYDKAEVKDYGATFTQTVLIDKSCVGKLDKVKGIIPIYTKVLDYVKDYKGKIFKTNLPIPKTFEYEVDMSDMDRAKKLIEAMFKVRKGVTEITYIGNLIEGGAMVTATEDDIPDDIKELVSLGVYTMDEALTMCTANSGKERRMVITKPYVTKARTDENGNQIPAMMVKTERKYENEADICGNWFDDADEDEDEDDSASAAIADLTSDDKSSSKSKEKAESSSDSDDDWLNAL